MAQDRNAEDFEPERPLVMTLGGELNGHLLGRWAVVQITDEPTDERGLVTEEVARRLWTAGALTYSDDLVATEVEDKRTGVARQVETEDLGSGWFLVRAPWSAEAKKVRGQAKAQQARERLIDDGMAKIEVGQPLTAPAFTISEEGSNGWFHVDGPGLDEPLRVRGEAAALAKRDELERAAQTQPPGPGGQTEPPAQPAPTSSGTQPGDQLGTGTEPEGDEDERRDSEED